MSFGNLRVHGAQAVARYGAGWGRNSASAFSGKSKTDLTVVTAEGDRVTISLAAQVKYAAISKGNAESVSASASSQVRVSVEGDLNDAELKDLGALLTNLDQAKNQALHPTTQDPHAADTGLGALTSLAAFSYRYRERVEAGSIVRINA